MIGRVKRRITLVSQQGSRDLRRIVIAIARANVGDAERGLQHRRHGGYGSHVVGLRKGDLQRAIAAHRDAQEPCRLRPRLSPPGACSVGRRRSRMKLSQA